MGSVRDRDVWFDVGLATGVTTIELLNMYLFNAGGRDDVLDCALLIVSAAVLVLRRQLPLLCALLSAAATITLAARHAPHIGLGTIAATYAVASFASRRSRILNAVPLTIGVWLVPLLTADTQSIPRNVALFGGAWILGQLTRDRRDQHTRLVAQTRALEHERQEKLALAAAAERARLAREVHDVLTHSVSVMVIQAQGAQTVGDDHARVRQALARIEETGQTALAELRLLLRADENDSPPLTPQPDLRRITDLARTTCESGIDVDLTLDIPDYALSAKVELSAYRIVQEALTNVMRHSGAQTASVTVRCDAQTLEIEVLDDGRGGATDEGGGRGVAGMRDRAAANGGSFEARHVDEGGFRVRARLPIT